MAFLHFVVARDRLVGPEGVENLGAAFEVSVAEETRQGQGKGRQEVGRDDDQLEIDRNDIFSRVID